MSMKDSDRIDSLRDRLYHRGSPPPQRRNHNLSDQEKEVPTSWQRPQGTKVANDIKRPTTAPSVPTPERAVQSAASASSATPTATSQPSTAYSTAAVSDDVGQAYSTTQTSMKRKQYRKKILFGGIGFFVFALLVSSFIMLFGGNTISGDNITIEATGPFTIGAGEVMPIQVGITNDNSVPIESAVLFVEYPAGTLSAADGEEQQRLTNERLQLDRISAGETVNIPLRAVVYGEENEEKTVSVSVEYRIEGSNARFFKEPEEPLRFKISSSPVSVTADALKQISSGQSTDITLTVESNAPTAIEDIIVRAEYPIGFDYTESTPAPVSGENVWRIDRLEPESSETIVITGVVIGKETDEYAINYTVGVPDGRDQDNITALFGTAQTNFEIEQPFLNVALAMGNVVNGTRVVEAGQPASVSVEVTNTRDQSIYDVTARVKLTGNAIADLEVGPPSGFYDSNTREISWDVSNSPDLAELGPGESTRLSFVIEADDTISVNPRIGMDVDVTARRVRESQVAERLVGTASGELRVQSEPSVRATITHGNSGFTSLGSIPPRVGEETTYTVTLLVENGSSDISETEVTATLPSYVRWLDESAGTGVLTYSDNRKSVTWSVGNVGANQTAQISFQVSLTPSRSQVDTTPVLIQSQSLRAIDEFTDIAVRDTFPAQTTEMSLETGYEERNGEVVE